MGWGRGGKRAGILFRASLFFHEGGEGGCNATHVEAAFLTFLSSEGIVNDASNQANGSCFKMMTKMMKMILG